jgi:hypothetical protein
MLVEAKLLENILEGGERRWLDTESNSDSTDASTGMNHSKASLEGKNETAQRRNLRKKLHLRLLASPIDRAYQ